LENRENNTINNEVKTAGAAGSKMVAGATILAVAGILSKVLGAIFRIPLTNLIGAEGMSYYGVAYPVYSFFLVLASAGLPVAISRMVSERIAIGDYRNAHRSYRVSMYVMIALGIMSFSICFFGAEAIAIKEGNPEAAWSLKALAPALLISPIVSAYRGYFQGQQNMIPTGTSQVFEQIARVAVGLTLAYLLLGKGLQYASAGATFGASAGLVAALIVILIMYRLKRSERLANIKASIKREESTKSLLKELCEIAVPITIGSTIMPLMMLLDAVIIMNRLQATGWSHQMSKVLYGLISAYCDSLIGFPGVFIDAISISLIPAVTAAFTLRKQDELNKNIQTGIKTMMVVAFPCAVGLIVMARPILYLLYPANLEEAEMAVPTLQILSVSIVTLSMMRTFSSSLQGIGKMVLPVVNLFIGAIGKIVISYVLVGIPALNIKGAATGSVIAYLIAAILNYMALKKYANLKIDLAGTFVKPMMTSVLMGVIAFATYKLSGMLVSSNAISTLVTILVAVAAYFVLIFVTKTVSREEAMILPKGDMIVKIAEKLHIL